MANRFPKRSTFTSPILISWKIILSAILLISGIAFSLNRFLPAFAAPMEANPDGDLRIAPITAYNFVVDSNILSPSTYGPESATLGAKYCNDGGNDLTDVYAYIGDFSGTPTPGMYPSRDSATFAGEHDHLLNTGLYSLTHEGGSAGIADATRYIGTIPAGECVTQYWLVSYPRTTPDGTVSVTGGSIKPDDDLWLEYDFWATANDGGTPLTADETTKVTMRNEISAAANKIWPNGDNKVPDEYLQAIADVLGWDTFVPGGGTTAYPGETVRTQGIWYDLGNVGFGFDNNGDLVPDHNAWLQPVGIPANYDPGCFRLVRTYGLVIVKLVDGGELLIPFEDQLYFEGIPDNTGAVGLVYYEYAALDGACTAGLTPYQEVASGYDNEKFNGDFGYGIPPLESVEPELTMDKIVAPGSTNPGGTLTYTISYTNPPTYTGGLPAVTVGNPELGIPLVVQENVPSGTCYAAGSADDNAPASEYNILYSTDNGTTWTSTEPGDNAPADGCNDTTSLQWWRTTALPPDTSDSVTYQVLVPSAYVESTVDNTAGLSFGNTDPFLEDSATAFVLGPNSLSGNVFSDTGAGAGEFANSLKDAGEGVFPNVTVMLYYDSDGDGVGDIFYASTTSDGSGDYSFTSLPDGNWVVEVDIYDSDITTGYGNTTPSTRAADLDSAHASATGVSQTGLDFGFAPVLSVDKTLDTTGTIRVNDKVTYTIKVSNNLPGDGTGAGGFCTYYVWTSDVHPTTGETPAGGGPTNAQWQTPENAIGRPDENFAYSVMSNNADTIGLSGMNIGDMGGTITNVEYIFNIHERSDLDPDDQFNIAIYYNNSEEAMAQLLGNDGTYFGTGGTGAEYVITGTMDALTITGTAGWAWSDFSADMTELQLEVKGAGGSTGDIDLDAAGFIITTDQTCSGAESTLNPVPLTDAYDSTIFSFVSADPQESSTGVGSITWDNLGPLYPGQTKSITVTLMANATATDSLNTATSSGAEFSDRRPANSPESDTALTTVAAASPTSGSISGFIWDDEAPLGWVDPNGYEGSDDFIENAAVTLYACKDPSTGELITDTGQMKECADEGGDWILMQTQYSAADGSYSFTNLSPGFYIVMVNENTIVGTSGQTGDPNETTGTCSTCDNASNGVLHDMDDSDFIGQIPGNTDVTNVNFGYPAPDGTASEIGDTLFYDWDGDGVQDAIDEGIPNVTVNLYNASGTLVDTDVTDQNGNYLFTALSAGAYTVEVDTTDPDFPSGLVVQTLDPDTSGVCAVCDNTGASLVDGTLLGSDYGQDFAYQPYGGYAIGDTVWLDKNANGGQSGVLETGIPDITVFLQVDFNGDSVWETVATAATDSNGNYLFENLPNGNYRVIVETADPDLPQDAFGNNLTASTPTQYDVTISGTDVLTADFGFYEPGAVGDTIFWDTNGDGEQDFGEPGIEGVTVTIYNDVDGNGVYDAGTDTYAAEDTTDADGHYLITGIPTDADGEAYVVVVDTRTGSPVESSTLTADPNADGLACTTSPEPWTDFYLYCDSQVSTNIYPGTSYIGADFGYQPSGSFGDYVWLDQNGDGVQDAGEIGLDFVDVTATTTDDVYVDGILNLGGTSVTVTTDSDGYYYFNNIFADSGPATWTITVDAADLPAGVDPSYDADGDDNGTTTLVIDSTGAVTAVGGSACSDCSLDADFGYTYDGNLSISGTVCLENSGADGVCDTDPSGVGANESAFSGSTVYLYIWTDDGNDTVESGETTQIGTTVTDANGDYSFANVTNGLFYVVSVGAPQDNLDLTTTFSAVGPPTTHVVATTAADGDVVSAYQTFDLSGSNVDNRDFAFENNQLLDFGDLPESYSTLLTNSPDGPRHVVPATPNLYLGASIDTETNGNPTVDASGDGADEDGVSFVGVWADGTYDAVAGTGGEIQVDVTGDGWLIGWIDFNRDGDFTDGTEMIISEAVSTGNNQSFTFDIPADTFTGTGDPTALGLYSRFRIFDSEPFFPSLSFAGLADNGEVEDYRPTWVMTIDKDTTSPGVLAGGQGSYTIVVRNEGSQILSNVSVSDVLPSGSGWEWTYASISHTESNASFTSDECVDGSAPEPADGDLNDFTCAKWNINAGGSVTLTVVVDIDSATPDGTYNNTVSASSTQTGTIDDDGTAAQDPDTPTGLDPVDDEDIAVIQPASIGDYVWLDANGDGVQDGGESGIDGVTVDLWLDVNINGQIDPGTDTKIGTQTTTGGGDYDFTNLTPGRYLVDVTDTDGVLNGYYQTFGSDPHDITVASGDDYNDADFGYNVLTVSLELIKSASPVIYDSAGDTITYTYTLHNAGNVELPGPFVVLDAKATVDCSGAAASLAPDDGAAGGSDETTCTATYTTTADDVAAQSVTNTATAYAGSIPALSVEKSASPATFSAVDEMINYSYTVTNIGNVPLTNISIDDDTSTNESCPQNTLAVGESMICTGTYTIDAAALVTGFVTNTVTVDSDETSPVIDAATVASDQISSMTIEKSASPGNFTHENQVIHYSYLVTNTGNTALSNIAVSDDKAFSVSCPAVTLAVGNSMTCTASYTITAAELAADLVTNTATANSAETSPVTDTLTISQVPVTSNIDTETVNLAAFTIQKEVYDPVATTWGESVTVIVGDTVNFHIVIENTGNVDLTNVSVSDAQCNATLTLDSGDDGDGILQTTETWTYLCSVTAASGTVTNTATADTDQTDPAKTDTAQYVGQNASLTIVKEVGTSDTGPWDDTSINVLVDADVYYRLTVTNNGEVALNNMDVSDPDVDTTGCTWTTPLAVGASTSCVLGPVTALAGTNTNTASAGADETGPDFDSDSAEYVGQNASLTIVKEVGTSDTGPWDDTSINVLVGADLYYQLTVTNNGEVALNNVDVSDPDVDTTGCTWTTPLAVGASTNCVLGPVMAASGTNTNTASAGSDETGADFGSDDAEYVGQVIDINLEKTPASQTILVGGSATFSLEVTNTGDLPLQITSLTDAFCDTINGPTSDTNNDGWLAIGETWIYQCVDDVVNANYTNFAEVEAEDANSNQVSDTATALVDVISPSVSMEKTVNAGNSGGASCPGVELISGINGADITYCFIVTNTGDSVLDLTTFADNDIDGGITLGNLTLASGSDADNDGLLDTSETWTYTYATTINGDVIPNTATINAQPVDEAGTAIPGTNEVSDNDTANVDEIVTDIVLDKNLTSGSPYTNVGEVLSYSFTVTNTGSMILAGPVTIDDDYIGSFTCGDLTTVGNNDTNFDPDEAITCTNNYTVQQADLDNGTVINTASASIDGETSNTDTANATAIQVSELTISKLPDIQNVPLDTTFSFTISVTNSGNTVLNDVQVTDDLESIFGANYTLIGAPAVSTTGLLPANASYDGDADINLLDPAQTRSLGAGQTETITITLQVSSSGTFVNTAFGQAEDPAGSPVGPESDVGSVTLSNVGTYSIEKNLVSSEMNMPLNGGNQQVAIGEVVTYQVEVGLFGADTTFEDIAIIDTLDHGLAFHSCTSISASFVIAGLGCDEGNGMPDVAPPISSPAGEDDGKTVYFYLGDITTPSIEFNSITLTYQAVVLNIDDNQSSPVTILNNTASWGTTNIDDSGDPLQITEPFMSLSKTSNNSVANAGDLVSFDLRIRHSANSTAPAYDVLLHDVIPAGLVYTPTTNADHRLESISGPAPTVSFASGEVQAYWSVIDTTEVAVVRLYASIDPAVLPGAVINNLASVEWTSLPGNFQTPRSQYNDFSTERWYDPADPSNVNVYGGVTSADSVTVGGIALPEELPDTGFAPNQITDLPPQTIEYQNYDNGYWLEIPILGISGQIAGVPNGENGWDTTWLWNQIGYLEGTAFPTWEGNTALTGHVYLPDGTPGPFERIGLLRWGNEVIIHANGMKYTYEVRTNRLVHPTNTSILGHMEEDWVTLITCSYFNQRTNEYRFRTVVNAVLMSIEVE